MSLETVNVRVRMGTINAWLRRIGLVLVVRDIHGPFALGPLVFEVTTVREYEERVRAPGGTA